ncbi:ATP-dependent DNA helicase RecG [Jannaschia sp. LMIT008]|uniref:ATP-dependent DNA helicase RecG n=1 Tax=Jannaschia maritima TaxID=3032585 RepID=UPI00281227F1|nr:ATP-dependent DNA helicase RecG [Jannaschia sp. LMIT008]
MAGRPERLFKLFGSLDSLPGVGPKTAKLMANLRIATPRDMVLTLPERGIDRRPVASIRDVPLPGLATVPVTIRSHRPAGSSRAPHRVEVEDARTTFQLVYFRARADTLERSLPVGERRIVSGRVELYDGVGQMPHPDHVLALDDPLPPFEPVYPLTAGLSGRVMRRAAAGAIDLVPDFAEWADGALVAERGWPPFRDALAIAHNPQGAADIAATAPARQRLAYDELFAHQITMGLARLADRARPGRATEGDGRHLKCMFDGLGFTPTDAQIRAMEEIAGDMAKPRRMNRLLQGDVGSGKTIVALAALLNAVEAGGQGVLMAPTEILARQHLSGLRPLAELAGVVVEGLTGRDKGREREGKLDALAAGDIHILVGTHAVFQRDVRFRDLRLAVIDEQHRFGVRQRKMLGDKAQDTDVLVMTATPIPRSLALTQFGDMEISVLDEKPPGRTPIKTATMSTGRMEEVMTHLRDAVAEGRQVYWVCPLVEDAETSDLPSAQTRFDDLSARFAPGQVGLVHGQMPTVMKDAAMARFVSGDTRILVATTVIEVGVDVPAASIMVIERADTFGLAQLHQLRGRVGRGATASTCLLLFEPPLGETAKARLQILRESEDGFRIAEEDLRLRGAGDVIGTAQSGLPRFRIADLERQAALMETAQSDARTLLHADPKLDGARGRAVRDLLWLLEQERALELLAVG